jgi:hypothetical protein
MIEEEPLVEEARLLERGSAEHDACPGCPVDLAGFVRLDGGWRDVEDPVNKSGARAA